MSQSLVKNSPDRQWSMTGSYGNARDVQKGKNYEKETTAENLSAGSLCGTGCAADGSTGSGR